MTEWKELSINFMKSINFTNITAGQRKMEGGVCILPYNGFKYFPFTFPAFSLPFEPLLSRFHWRSLEIPGNVERCADSFSSTSPYSLRSSFPAQNNKET